MPKTKMAGEAFMRPVPDDDAPIDTHNPATFDVLIQSNETGNTYTHYWIYQSSSVSNVLTLTQGTHTLSVTGPSSTFKAIDGGVSLDIGSLAAACAGA